MRSRTLLLPASMFAVATIAAAGVAVGGQAPSTPGDPGTRVVTESRRASAVLRAWDRHRAEAWARGDAVALSGLYTPRSRTGAGDVRDLRRWRSRGMRVIALRQQVAALLVRDAGPSRLVVTVTERTVDAVAVGHHRRTALPRSDWAEHQILLRHVRGRWLVAEVVAQPAR